MPAFQTLALNMLYKLCLIMPTYCRTTVRSNKKTRLQVSAGPTNAAPNRIRQQTFVTCHRWVGSPDRKTD